MRGGGRAVGLGGGRVAVGTQALFIWLRLSSNQWRRKLLYGNIALHGYDPLFPDFFFGVVKGLKCILFMIMSN